MKKFLNNESGAVTIDWVALAAGLLILGIGIVGFLANELQSVLDEVETQLLEASTDNNGGVVDDAEAAGGGE
ncbi:MAG: Flp family type IVb pilin [Paracoccaceae bacterium]